MAKKDEFSFDDFDTGFDNSDDSLNDFDIGNGFDDFSSSNNDVDDTESKKSLIKTALIMVGVGIAIVIFGILLSSLLNNISGDMGKQETNVTDEQAVENGVVNPNNEVISSQDNGSTQSGSYSGWVEFNSATEDIILSEDSIESTFTITGIEHYVKKVSSSGDNIAIKTILTGNLSGFVGTYELELPYSKGQKLKLGTSFKVNVQYGVYGERTVIGEIKY